MFMSTIDKLKKRYHISIILTGVIAVSFMYGYDYLTKAQEKIFIYKSVQNESDELKLAIENTLTLANVHIHAMQKTVETSLANPEFINTKLVDTLLESYIYPDSPFEKNPLENEIGSLSIDVTKRLDPKIFKRNVGALLNMMPEVIALHTINSTFKWSYFYDAYETFEMSYPLQNREEFLKQSETTDFHIAMVKMFEGNGSYPLKNAGKENNPQRKNVWTIPYMDCCGGGLMVTLVAPIYLKDEYIGIVATDITLDILDRVLLQVPLSFGRAIIVDKDLNVLADSHNVSNSKIKIIKLSEIIKEPIAEPSKEWLVYPLNTTTWKLLIYLSKDDLEKYKPYMEKSSKTNN